MSVCAKKSICVICFEEEKIRLTVLFRSPADKCSVIWFDWLCCVKKRKFDSLCCFEVQQTNASVLRFDCSKCRDLIRGECLYEKVDLCLLCEEEKIQLTVLFRSAAEKCSAPLSPIWLFQRFNWVSVCVKKSICVFCVEEEKIQLTLLFRSAADKCSAPLSPIWLLWRFNSVSVCVKKSICVFCVKKRKFDSLCCFEVQQTNVLLLCLRFGSERVRVCSVSIWKSRSVSSARKKRKFDSLCCFEVQQTNVLLLCLRFDSDESSSVFNVYMKKSICVFCVKKRKFNSLCCFEVQQKNVLLLYLRFDCSRDLIGWVSVWKSRSVCFVWKKRKFNSLCCFEVQQTNVLLLCLRFDCCGDLIRWVSVWKSRSVSSVWRRENSTHCVVSKCSRQMFCSFVSDLVLREFECVQCLYEKVDLCLLRGRRENSTHCVVSKCSRQMFCSFVSDSIRREFECVQCLYEKVDLCLLCEEEKIQLTVLFRSAADKCSAPLSPIWLFRDLIGWVSVWKSRSVSSVWRRENSTHCVVSKCSRQMFCSFVSDLIVVEI